MTNLKKILIVDDEHELLTSLKLVLESSGFQVTACNNVDHAVNAINNSFFDLVITDIEMPVKTGLDLIRILREGLDVSIPIIIMTGKATTDYLAEAIKVGASDFIPKPIIKKNLIQIIDNQLKKAKRLKLDFNLTHSLNKLSKMYVFHPIEFFEKSIVEFLNSEIRKSFKLNPMKRNEIYLILEEIITNAFYHGLWQFSKEERMLDRLTQMSLINQKHMSHNSQFKDCFVKVEFLYDKVSDSLVISVKDTGAGFDFSKYMSFNSNTVLDSLNPTGRGLFLIKTLSNKVDFFENGSKIQVIVNLDSNDQTNP